MLNRSIQEQLAKRYGGEPLIKMMKEAFDRVAMSRTIEQGFQEEREANAAVSFTDIAGFSSTVSGWTATKVRKFLDDYYSVAIPPIYDSQGVIDRIVGDGILSIYSEYFDQGMTAAAAERKALRAAEFTVVRLHGSNKEAKVAISNGPLLFCKTGLSQVYEDYTVIGEPITVAYRIEDIASANEILLPEGTDLAAYIWRQVQSFKAEQSLLRPLGTPATSAPWTVSNIVKALKGVGEMKLLRQKYNGSE